MILENLRNIQRKIEAAALRADRDPKKIELVAVTKKAATEDVSMLLQSREIRYVGESRIQDALERKSALGAQASLVSWRFIGHLQTNKARQALEMFDWIDSLDSLKLAQALHARLAERGLRKRVLVRVKLLQSPTQSGVQPEELASFLAALTDFPTLIPCGLMTIAPQWEPVEEVRPCFKRMRELLKRHFPAEIEGEPPHLSMGMSRDFEIAVEEGADLVRVGTALFGGALN